MATTAGELNALAAKSDTRRLLGLFATGNMDGALDRKFLKGGGVKKFPEQPDLTEQVQAALNVLSKNDAGFFLMVESGLIDKYAHLLDMERAVYDTIMLDNAVRLARDWARARGDDTLILVLADHNHPNSLVGTISDDMSHDAERAAARARWRLREGRISELSGSRCRGLSVARRCQPPDRDLLGRACRTTTKPSVRSSTTPTSRP